MVFLTLIHVLSTAGYGEIRYACSVFDSLTWWGSWLSLGVCVRGSPCHTLGYSLECVTHLHLFKDVTRIITLEQKRESKTYSM